VDGTLRLVAVGIDPIAAGSIGKVILRAIDGGETSIEGVLRTSDGTEQVIQGEPAEDMPVTFELEGNYPNPFNPTTTIQYSLPEAADVRVEVFNSIGRRISVLFTGRQEAGRHRLTLRAEDWPTGLYIYRVQAGNQGKTSSMLLVK
jgi:hypothetical protein